MQLLLFGLALVFYYALHSVLANNRVKHILIGKLISKRAYRLFFNFVAIGSLLAIFFFYKKIDAELFFENEIFKMVGGFLVVLGLILSVIALRQYNLAEFMGTQQYTHVTPPAPEKLKTTGFNSFVRHPLYFATLIILWGFFLFQPTDLVLMIGVISSIYIYVGTKLEEEKLVNEFGQAYLEYQKEVKMLIPFLL